MTHEDIARVAHEINRAYCQALGDHSQSEWDDAPEWQKESARKGVSLHLTDPNAGPAASHYAWMREKYLDDWEYGPVKDSIGKKHPCLVDFSELPKEQQAKDFLFRQVVHSLKGFLV